MNMKEGPVNREHGKSWSGKSGYTEIIILGYDPHLCLSELYKSYKTYQKLIL